MAKRARTVYVCTECGTQHVKWQGRCNGCGAWNSLVEEQLLPEPAVAAAHAGRRQVAGAVRERMPLVLADIDFAQVPRIPLPDGELMRVLDGGIVPGSLILLGGEPGIGKSTLLLQLALQLAGHRVLYVTGEESEQQVKLRAVRLPSDNPELYILAETALHDIFGHARSLAPAVLIVDSIQTLFLDEVESAPGSVAQVRECTGRLMRFAKESGTAVLLVGHVNKEGMIAGPKVLEHMVDVVLEFEGERHGGYRIVRSSKNRFGATPEIGIYEMRTDGLRQVPNPSELFLSHSLGQFSGVAIAATLQAQRPLLVETQALVADAAYGTAQRSATGFDLRRLHMLLAVLEKKAGLKLGQKDVFVNLAGGIRLDDPALDLALAAAVVSSAYDLAIDARTGFAAEIGLTGEVRPVTRLEQRIAEAAKLGFRRLFVGDGAGSLSAPKGSNLEIVAAGKLDTVFRHVFGGGN